MNNKYIPRSSDPREDTLFDFHKGWQNSNGRRYLGNDDGGDDGNGQNQIDDNYNDNVGDDGNVDYNKNNGDDNGDDNDDKAGANDDAEEVVVDDAYYNVTNQTYYQDDYTQIGKWSLSLSISYTSKP